MDRQKIQEITINGTIYKVSIVPTGDDTFEVYASPCTLPSAVFNVATVRLLQNRCMQFEFYEITIYTDPVEIIIDCNLCQGVRRAIEIYIDQADLGGNGCSNRGFFF